MARKPLKDDLLDRAIQANLGETVVRGGSDTTIPQTHNTTNNTVVSQTVPQSDPQTSVDALFTTQTVFLTIRIPEGVSDWLERKAFNGRKRKVTKQSLVAEALREYIEKRITEE